LVQKGKATTIYCAPTLMTDYRKACREKLGEKAGPRIVRLIKTDLAGLLGKPVVDDGEDVKELQNRLKEAFKERDEVLKILKNHGVLDELVDLAEEYNLNYNTPEKARDIIQKMLQAFNAGKISTITDGDFQLFISLCEMGIERHKILNRLTDLRIVKYAPNDTPLETIEGDEDPEEDFE